MSFTRVLLPQAKVQLRSQDICNRRRGLWIRASKKSQRKQEVVLVQDIPGVGKKGTMTTVNNGHYRNYLFPLGLAAPTTESYLRSLQLEQQNKEKAAAAAVAKAKAMATALQTIGKFTIKKRVGQGNQIFGSVTTQEVVDAIEQQTGRALDKRLITLPDIRETGTFSASVKLHPEVVGEFRLVIQREKNVVEEKKK